jgi:hypothetical protein
LVVSSNVRWHFSHAALAVAVCEWAEETNRHIAMKEIIDPGDPYDCAAIARGCTGHDVKGGRSFAVRRALPLVSAFSSNPSPARSSHSQNPIFPLDMQLEGEKQFGALSCPANSLSKPFSRLCNFDCNVLAFL